MRRRLLLLGLMAVIPAAVSAQETKLVNCRTLESAGNFVGADEVIVDDMVCQKVKAGTDAAAKPQEQKPVIGTVISDTPTESVVDAAKAAGKRVASRRELEATKNPAAATAPAAENTAPLYAPTKITEVAAQPLADSEPAAAAATSSATPEPAPVAQPTPPKVTVVPEPAPPVAAPAPPQSAKPEVTAPVDPAPQVATAPAEAAKPKAVAPSEFVLSSAPASAPPADRPAAEPITGATTEIAAPAPATNAAAESTPEPAEPAVPPPAATLAAAGPPVDPTHPATASGFYDANAPKGSVNGAPQTNTGFASAEQVNAALVPGAKTVPATVPTQSSEATPEPQPEHNAIAAARVPFDEDRDRSVKLGDFAQPHEVSPDLNAEHRSSVDPSDADGFQDRQRPDCTKNITLAGLKGEKLVLGVPKWAAKWIEKNEKRMPTVCFSETPMKGARNYLIVFYTPGGGANSKDIADAAVNPPKGSSAAGVGTFTTNYGSTWHYSFDRNVGTTILTQDDADEPHGAPGQVLYATAYTEEGVPVTQRWPGQAKKEIKANDKNPKKLKGETEALEHVSSDLLSQMVEDIEKL